MKLCLGAADRDVHDLGDLLVLVALHVVEHEHHAGALGESGDGTLEVHPCVDPGVRGVFVGFELAPCVLSIASSHVASSVL